MRYTNSYYITLFRSGSSRYCVTARRGLTRRSSVDVAAADHKGSEIVPR